MFRHLLVLTLFIVAFKDTEAKSEAELLKQIPKIPTGDISREECGKLLDQMGKVKKRFEELKKKKEKDLEKECQLFAKLDEKMDDCSSAGDTLDSVC